MSDGLSKNINYFDNIIVIDTLTRKSIGELIRTFAPLRASVKRHSDVFIRWEETDTGRYPNASQKYAEGIVRISSRSKPTTTRVANAIKKSYAELRAREAEQEKPLQNQ